MSFPSLNGLLRAASFRTHVGCVVAAMTCALLATPSRAEPPIPGAPPGRVETGIPSFIVLGPEALGLSSAPTGIHILPDGRVLVNGQSEIAFGDGVRWEAYRAADGEEPILRDVAVDGNGQIYFGTAGAISRLQIGTDGLWRSTHVLAMPEDARVRGKTMTMVRELGDDWYWYSQSGCMVRWRPGRDAALIDNNSTTAAFFQVGGQYFASDIGSGMMYRLGPTPERVTAFADVASALITASAPYDDHTVLLGTYASGFQLFDGKKTTPFGQTGALNTRLRVNDLCALGNDSFAAAIDTWGIIFFDRSGKTIQTLDARVDHRLGRVEKLCFSRDGVLWALLNEGVARVDFPSRLTRYEPLIPSGLRFALPTRHRGDLWMLAEGRALRGLYDEAGRLDKFVVDDPPGRFSFTLQTIGDDLFDGNDLGLYVREDHGWKLIGPGIINARVGITRTPTGALVYAARGEIGTIERRGSEFAIHRVPVPALEDNYNAIDGGAGIAWLELGIAHAGRVDARGPEPTIQLFGPESGLGDGWVMISSFDSQISFKLPGHVLRFDAASARFVDDVELVAKNPQFTTAGTRLQVDAFGRLWYTDGGRLWSWDYRKADAKPHVFDVPFNVTECKFEQDGVMWLLGAMRVLRYDPRAIGNNGRGKPAVIVTSVQFPNSNRQVFDLRNLGHVPYVDNTMIFRFAAPGNAFSATTKFEVQLEGVTDSWASAGNTGQAVFNRLKEGRYVFRVRSVARDGTTSEPARVAFTIDAPWFRSVPAWFAYVLFGTGALVFSIRYPVVRQRREKRRLETLVAKRTEELNKSNQQLGRQIQETTEKSNALAASEERYRALSADLEHRVVERTAQLSISNEELRQRESLFRLIFEHAPVGISWKRVDLDNVHHFNETYRAILELADETSADFSPLAKLLHPEDLPRQQVLEQQIVRGEVDNGRLELRFNLPSGRMVWTSVCVAVVRNASGQIVQVIGILEDISLRKEAERKLAATYKELLDASRMAGMAEVATGVLHNVGNVLNSLNVSANLLATTVRGSKIESLKKLSGLIDERASDLGAFLTQDPKGRLVPELLRKLAENGAAEREWLTQEISSMQKNIDHIKDIVAMQQSYATVIGVTETLEPSALFEDAIRMNAAALSRHDVKLVREFEAVPLVCVEKGKVLQILINVIRNAKYACDDGQVYGAREKIVTVRLETADTGVRFIVRDNGIGIAPENLTRIFAHGFTTRAYGHGFGLHSSALAAREMHGSLTVHSDGLGQGATFILEIPAAAAGEVAALPTTVGTGNTNSPIVVI